MVAWYIPKWTLSWVILMSGPVLVVKMVGLSPSPMALLPEFDCLATSPILISTSRDDPALGLNRIDYNRLEIKRPPRFFSASYDFHT